MRNILVLLTLSSGAFGCGLSGGDDGAAEDAFRVALLTSGPVSDAGWYAGGYEGLMFVRDSLGASVSHQQTRTPAEFDEAFFSYASSGYDLIFAHGFEYQDAAIRTGARFPNTTIVVSGGGQIADNVVPLVFRLEQGSDLAGMAAAGMSRSGVLGMVGGVEIPPAQRTFRAFEAGARAPRIRTCESWRPSSGTGTTWRLRRRPPWRNSDAGRTCSSTTSMRRRSGCSRRCGSRSRPAGRPGRWA
ncbi:MAG: BMP family ABC transporter substrate-binding protein [Gemmatimonadota bacterium]